MSHGPQIKIPATYMRGGTSKGVFFKTEDLPLAAQQAGAARDALLLRVIGSPDPYGKHTDGMGGGTSSTSKVVLVTKSNRVDHDIDYTFGQVAINKPVIDWSGNCGNLTAAVGTFAISQKLVAAERIPEQGHCTVRIWQTNIQKTIIARIPITQGVVQETGDFVLDGVTFPAAEVQVEFVDPAEGDAEQAGLFPTKQLVDELVIPGLGTLSATLINAGIPTIFINGQALGYSGTELQADINNDPTALAKFELIRAHGALKMGLIADLTEAATRQHTPKIVFVAPAAGYTAASGKVIAATDIHLLVRALSMGQLHHAMMGTAAVAIATAAAIPGTLVNLAAGGSAHQTVIFGHPSGTLQVGAHTEQQQGQWQVNKVIMSRSARVLMEGWVRVPDNS